MVASLRRPGSRWWIWVADPRCAGDLRAPPARGARSPCSSSRCSSTWRGSAPGARGERAAGAPMAAGGDRRRVADRPDRGPVDARRARHLRRRSPTSRRASARFSRPAGQHALALVVICGFVPAVAVISLALRRGELARRRHRAAAGGPALRDARLGLRVRLVRRRLPPAWDIERYVEYVVPLAFVALMLVPGRVSLPVAAGVGARARRPAAARGQAAQPRRAARGRRHRAPPRPGRRHLRRATPGSGWPSLCVARGDRRRSCSLLRPPRALAAGSGAAGGRRPGPRGAPGPEPDELAHRARRSPRSAATAQPADLDWVDHHAKGTVGIFSLNVDNPNVYRRSSSTRRSAAATTSRAGCRRRARSASSLSRADGLLRGPAGCEPPRHAAARELVHPARPSTASAESMTTCRTRAWSRSAPHPRVLSFVSLPCVVPGTGFKGARLEVRPCTGRLDVQLWPAARARSSSRFLGGSVQHYGQLAADTGSPDGLQLQAQPGDDDPHPGRAGAAASSRSSWTGRPPPARPRSRASSSGAVRRSPTCSSRSG